MIVKHFNYSDLAGGAARAAYRIHHALRAEGVDSFMQVVKSTSGDWTVSSPKGVLFNLGKLLRPQIAAFSRSLLTTKQHSPISSAMLPSRWPNLINKSNADLVHLHWLCAEMMSVEDIGRIKKPSIWTLHDMWAFCGGEHVPTHNRWRDGYTKQNRPVEESGFDLNRWVWTRKLKAWKKPIQIVTPSRWLANCVRESALMHDWPITTIPNGVNTEIWRPFEKKLAKDLLQLPNDRQLLAFGVAGSMNAHHKGFDLLIEALNHLRGELPKLELLVIGQMRPSRPPELGFPIHYLGHLQDEISMIVALNAADAVIIPSRIDNLPNMGLEALACGTPLISFNTCGLPDIIKHGENGYLATAFEPIDLAEGIKWIFTDDKRHDELSKNARRIALSQFSIIETSRKYLKLYNTILSLSTL